MQKSNGYLYEVSLLRPFAILLLVLYHAFIPYIHGWKQQFNGFEENIAYWWIAKTSYACMLELFVFISGYVFALHIQKKQPSFYDIMRGKLQRLIIPCILFGIIYIALLYNWSDIKFPGILYELLCGIGHLWFLPMLFWTILLAFLIQNSQLRDIQKTILVCLLPIGSILPLPFQQGTALYYILFFYAGIYAYAHRENIFRQARSKKKLVFIAFSAIACFVFGTLLTEEMKEQVYLDNIGKFLSLTAQKYIKLLYSGLGVYFLFLLACRIVRVTERTSLRTFLLTINNCCFGIYIFQQFVLMLLYFHTNIPTIVGNIWIPWIGFMVSIITSFLLTYVFRLTNLGKKLI